ncbi:MAG TPA: hypothetical protein VFB98_03640 [Candidatus Deferrimicrobium sp.]|nr:hypothetical protein [Candidatus Deferrimicrobium sp.]
MKNYNRLLGIAGVVFGLCNIIPAFAEGRWYALLCFLVLGIPELVFGILMTAINSQKPTLVRAQSWVDELAGIAILVLALSPFYVSQMLKAFNFIAAIGLIITGLYGFYTSSRKLGLSILP